MNRTNNNNIKRDCILCDKTCGVTSQFNGGKPATFKNTLSRPLLHNTPKSGKNDFFFLRLRNIIFNIKPISLHTISLNI